MSTPPEPSGAAKAGAGAGRLAKAAASGATTGPQSAALNAAKEAGKMSAEKIKNELAAEINANGAGEAGAALGASGGIGPDPEQQSGASDHIGRAIDERTKDARQKAKRLAIAGGVQASQQALPVLFFMMLLKWMMQMAQMGLSLLASLLKAIWAAITHAVHAVMHFFAHIGGGIAGALGFSQTGAAATFIGYTTFMSAGILAPIMLVSSVVVSVVTSRETGKPLVNCAQVNQAVTQTATDANQQVAAATGADGGMTANAQKVYSYILNSDPGANKVMVSGILGNFEAESTINPAITQSGASDSDPAVGLGLGQWTASRHTDLVNYAKSQGKPWQDMGLQMDFLFNHDGSNSTVAKSLLASNPSSPSDAALQWHNRWEMSADNSSQVVRRLKFAESWYAAMAGWKVDPSLKVNMDAPATTNGDGAPTTALGAAGATTVDANVNAATQSSSSQGCSTAVNAAGTADNSTLAKAALSYAWPQRSQSFNNGTPLYQELFSKIFPGNPYFESCDSNVATAVHWAGVDKDYPPNNVYAQWKYVNASPIWQKIDWGGDSSKLQPGDIIINYHMGGTDHEHTVMWVGHDLVNQAFGSKALASSTVVEASSGTRSPAASSLWDAMQAGEAWRIKTPNPDPALKNYVPTSASMASWSTDGITNGDTGAAGAATVGGNSDMAAFTSSADTHPTQIAKSAPMTSGDSYAAGNCTAYAYERRKELGKAVGGTWGDAKQWPAAAKAAGFGVDRNPKPGDVYIDPSMGDGGTYGHAMVVEKVISPTHIVVSEMNYMGKGIVDVRDIPAVNPAGSFIH